MRISQTFRIRAAGIADHAYNPHGALYAEHDFRQSLDETERQRRNTPIGVM